MHRFFVSAQNIQGSYAYLDKEEAHHIKKVLRLKEGDKVVLFDGHGKEYQAVLEQNDIKELIAKIQGIQIQPPPLFELCLVQGIAKGDKMEIIIQKATEIGVSCVYPLLSEHTVVRIKDDNVTKKINRWQHIAREACKQCRSNFIPEIKTIINFQDLLQEAAGYPAVLLYENEQHNSMRQVLKMIKGQVFQSKKLFLIVGPEGGFSKTEISEAKEQGFFTTSLGSRILRTETAGIVASSIIMYEYGCLD